MFDFGDLPEEGDEEIDRITAEAGDTLIFYPGDVVKGFFLRAQWYLATVLGDNGDGTFTIEWNDGDAKDLIKSPAELKLVRRSPNAPPANADAEQAAMQRATHARAEEEAKQQAERRAREEQERAEAERKTAKIEMERAEKEANERAEAERKIEAERSVKEAKERAEAERKAKEQELAQTEAKERVEADRKAKEDSAAAARAEDVRKAKEKVLEEEQKAAKPAEEDDDDDLPDLVEEEEAKPEETKQEQPAEETKQVESNQEQPAKEETLESLLVEQKESVENSQPKQVETSKNDVEKTRQEAEDFAKEERERRQRAMEEQKKNAAYQRREREKRVLERAGGRITGARVKLVDMTEKPQMNGACGTLVEEKGERWIVNLDGCVGVGKGKWMVNRKNLLAAQWNCTEPKIPYSIVGSWNNWAPADMAWDADRQCWHSTVTVGDRGWESFQFISEHDPNKCIHPDQKDATPHMPHKMLGPDFEGHGQNWSVGKHPLDKGRKGAVFEVRLFVWEDEGPRVVEWSQPGGAAQEAPSPKGQKRERFCIAGSWNNWTVKDMDWDDANQHYHHTVQVTSQGWESFQILLEGDYKKCIHPSISEANPYVPYTLCGPDNRGHGKNWCVGKHSLDKGSKGAKYKIRFFPAVGGRAGLVDWEPVTGNMPKTETSKATNGRKRYCIAGTWGNWAATDMGWDEKRRCYHYTVRLGLNGWESFQILVDGNYKQCIHPDCSDATPHDKHEISGPDTNGHGKNWTIGRHRLDLGSRGSRFEVRLYLDDASKPRSVDWERVPTPGLGQKD